MASHFFAFFTPSIIENITQLKIGGKLWQIEDKE